MKDDTTLARELHTRADRWGNQDIADHANFTRWNRGAIHLRILGDTLRTGTEAERRTARTRLARVDLDALEARLQGGEDTFAVGLPTT